MASARIVLSVGVIGKAYALHGTTMETRITVIDKVPSDNPSNIPCIRETLDLPQLLPLIEQLPQRSLWQHSTAKAEAAVAKVVKLPKRTVADQPQTVFEIPDVAVLEYELVEWSGSDSLKDALYESYRPQRVWIHSAKPHPSLLCESAALALVSPPAPTYKPHLPRNIITQGKLSEAQLKSVIYAGQTHCEFLSGSYIVDDSWDNVTVAAQGEENAVKFRRGWFLGDGTGCGKGRQIAGIVLDNWCQGRSQAIWVSKSSALVEDARRDWCALGGNEKDIIDLSNIKLGDLIPFSQGILFCTYSTLRSQKNGKSRLKQIVEWAGADFQGTVAFDECHAMGNAMAQDGKLGLVAASQQGVVGLRLENALSQARVVYVFATGATKVSNLSYANRLGLWHYQDITHCGHFLSNPLITICNAGSSFQHSMRKSNPGFYTNSLRPSIIVYRRIISATATASPSAVYTVSPDIAIAILFFLAHSNQSLTCADSGFLPSLQAATNTASGDLIPFQVRIASFK
ncbi:MULTISPECIES: strawberry notch family protein [unclassified Nostoc]|uniref:strawberry notch family protein n=1 Tax=unclassified Nostoc TaxID=2593658 RepID=UPI002AD327C1|nr:strawberry notch family protein [Nostoc sp. DedQUE03]MDZ7976457.1 strawberry notch family protein [Nostoc sp. DedQUE03]MDZ8042780.1 strawberry notch family protein [Nostoc sp. DedQUE02]